MAKKDLQEKIEAALDIADKMKQFDSTTDHNSSNKDDELRRRAEERKENVAKIRAEMEKKKDNTDEVFIKDNLKRLIENAVETVSLLQDELRYDPSGRTAECMGALINAAVGGLNSIKDYDNDRTKIGFEREKIDIKKATAAAGGGGINGKIICVGKMTDVLKAINDQKFQNMKEVDAVVEKETVEHNAPGTPYQKDDK
jgi:hypothetical protein